MQTTMNWRQARLLQARIGGEHAGRTTLKHGKMGERISQAFRVAGIAATIGVFAAVAGHAAHAMSQGGSEETAQARTKWEIKHADWGADGQRIDVTLRLRQVLYTNANGEVRVDSV